MALPSKETLALARWNFETSSVWDMDFERLCPYNRGMDLPPQRWCFDRNDLVVLAWYPSCWKTEFTYFLAQKNADKGVKVLYITLELTPQYLLERLAMKKAGVNKKERQEKKYTEQQREIMNTNFLHFKNYPNIKLVGYKQAPTIEDIEISIRNWKKEWYDLFFIDNLGKIAGDTNEINRFTDITNKLQSLKNELWTCIFILHHMGKPWKGAEYEEWGIAGIRWSQKIIDNATMVLELFRDLDPERDKEKTTLTLLKDTMSWHTGKIHLLFNKWDYAVNPNGWDTAWPMKEPDSSKWWSRHSAEDHSGWSKI